MAWGTKKTEHAGAKKGTGAFYGRKADVERGSNYRRRQDGKSTINAELLTVIEKSSVEVVSVLHREFRMAPLSATSKSQESDPREHLP